jgi:hypothetical protein
MIDYEYDNLKIIFNINNCIFLTKICKYINLNDKLLKYIKYI